MLITLNSSVKFTQSGFYRNSSISKYLLIFIGLFLSPSLIISQGVCTASITCPGDTVLNNDPGLCGAVLDYSIMIGSDCSVEAIVNGDFETGDFTGWQNSGSGSGFGYTINDGTFDPDGPGMPTLPISGSYDAVSSQSGPGLNLISSGIILPDVVISANLSWADRIENWAPIYIDPLQEYRVELLDAGMSLISVVYSTDPGDLLSQPGPNLRSFDVTAELALYGGNMIYLRFAQEDVLLYFNVTVDDVSLLIEGADQTAGLPSGSEFPVGMTTNSFEFTDPAGATATCSFEVTVNDNEAPLITCPNDTIFDLPPLTCDTIVVYADPVATDNCDIPIVTQTDVTGLTSGDAFPIGTTTLIYTALDNSGNSSTCSFDVIVNDTDPENVGCININISLDEQCSSEITPMMVLVGDSIGCPTVYDIVVLDEYGNEWSNIVDDSYIGLTLQYSIDQAAQNFSCWGDVIVEDKFDPQIACRNDTMSCGEYMMNPFPIVTENCSDYELILLNELIQDVQCDDPEISKRIVRTFKAIDAAGNESPECNDTLFLRKFDVDDVVMPEFDQTITCINSFPMDANGNPDPEVYGVPMFDGAPLYPNQLVICNTVAHYDDVTIIETDCIKKVMRTWTVTTWYCGQDDTRISNQLFTLKDRQDPIVVCPNELTVNSDPGLDCSATVELEEPIIVFECSEYSYTVHYRVADPNTQQPTGEFTDEGVSFNPNTNRYTITGLPYGQNWIRYTVTDICGNETECFNEITVLDDKDPVAVCENFTVVSVPVDGTAQVYAESFDDGSFDDCEFGYMEVARMTDNCGISGTDFQDVIEFCCADVGEDVMVRLRVYDASGNTNECMVIVEVQDKIDPVLQPLPDITVSCTYDFDPENLSVFGNIVQDPADITEILLPPGTQFETGSSGYDGLVTDNCEMTIVELLPDMTNVNNCGLGYAYRSFILSDANGNEIFTDQYITIENFDSFGEDDITWPLDYEAYNICDGEELLPDELPFPFNEPYYDEDECELIGLTYEDERFDIGLNGACFKIIRHWKVIDWCQLVNSQFPIWEYDQVIKVFNNIDPEITGATGQGEVVCTYDVDCDEGGFIELIASGQDDCTIEEDLFWTYMLDLFDDGQNIIEGFGNDASGVYDVGIHRIIWRLEDKCGNVANNPLEYTFEIRNCKAPTAYCISGLSTELEPMDLNGDQDPDDEMAIVSPEMFDAGSNHVCGYEVFLSFSSDINDVERVFNCDDLGEQAIELWVTDINGNQSFCVTYIIVEDNNDTDICDGSRPLADVSGLIYTETDIRVDEVEITLEGAAMAPQMTDDQGSYAFMEMETGGNYVVVPSRDTDYAEGVSTLDLVLIQKHILGLSELEGPFNRIAADINRNGNISATDLVQLRKLILGSYQELPDNTSWRFVEESHEFIDPTDPWFTEFPERSVINDLENDMIIDFIAIKTGDVNGSIEAGSQTSTVRGDESLRLGLNMPNVEQGKVYDLILTAEESQTLAGIQMTIEFDNQALEFVELEGRSLDITEANYSLHRIDEGLISMSYNENGAKELLAGTELMVIKVMSKETGKLQIGEDVSVSNAITKSEAYKQQGDDISTIGIDLVERDDNLITGLTMAQNVPNPWTNSTSIGFEIAEDSEVEFRVLDIAGRLLYESVDYFSAGYNVIVLDGANLPVNGVLFYEITNGNETKKAKMLRLE